MGFEPLTDCPLRQRAGVWMCLDFRQETRVTACRISYDQGRKPEHR